MSERTRRQFLEVAGTTAAATLLAPTALAAGQEVPVPALPVPALPKPPVKSPAPVGPGAPYGSYQSEIYIAGMSAGTKPIFTTNLSDLEAAAAKVRPRHDGLRRAQGARAAAERGAVRPPVPVRDRRRRSRRSERGRSASARGALRELRTDAAAAWRELEFSTSVQARLGGVGVLSRHDAERLGTVGPAARASGVREDLREDSPRLWYGDFTPARPLAETGDVAARLQVRAAGSSRRRLSCSTTGSAPRSRPERPRRTKRRRRSASAASNPRAGRRPARSS